MLAHQSIYCKLLAEQAVWAETLSLVIDLNFNFRPSAAKVQMAQTAAASGKGPC